MSSSFEKYQKRRLITSYFSVVISIALVLFLLGILGLLVLNTKKVADYFKETIAVGVYFKDTAKDVEMKQLEKTLSLAAYTKSIKFVSKEEAAAAHSEALGENFVDYLGENPLQNSIDLYLNADYVSAEKVEEIANEIASKDFVEEVGEFAGLYPIKKAIVSSVGRLSEEQARSVQLRFPTIILSHKTPLPFSNDYGTPHTLGVDRIALVSAFAKAYPKKNGYLGQYS